MIKKFTALMGCKLVRSNGLNSIDTGGIVFDTAGVIVYVGERCPPEFDDRNTEFISIQGLTVFPGFFNCHVHFHLDGLWGMLDRGSEYPPYAVFETIGRMRSMLESGVTFARDLGGTPAGFRVGQVRGDVVGPRLQVAVRLLSHTGGHADMTSKEGFDFVSFSGQGHEICDNEGEALISTRRVLRDGADVIKVCATGGITTPADSPDDEGLSQDEISAVVAEGRRHGGVPVAAHAQGAEGIKNAIRAGAKSIEHCYLIDDEGIDLALEYGTFLVPTLSAFDAAHFEGAMRPEARELALRLEGRAMENVGSAISRGVSVALGTDAPASGFADSLRELGRLVDAGMSTVSAVEAGTSVAADLCGVSDAFGSLEVGKQADLVVCEGDPISRIRFLSDPGSIKMVIQKGIFIKGNEYRALLR